MKQINKPTRTVYSITTIRNVHTGVKSQHSIGAGNRKTSRTRSNVQVETCGVRVAACSQGPFVQVPGTHFLQGIELYQVTGDNVSVIPRINNL